MSRDRTAGAGASVPGAEPSAAYAALDSGVQYICGNCGERLEGNGAAHACLPPGVHRIEKERVYAELERVQHKCARLKRELNSLRKANASRQNAALRAEAGRYKQALSNILHRLDTADGCPAIADADLRSLVVAALELRGLKLSMRSRIARTHAQTKPEAKSVTQNVVPGGGEA